jgi:hypothetical protein
MPRQHVVQYARVTDGEADVMPLDPRPEQAACGLVGDSHDIAVEDQSGLVERIDDPPGEL